MKLRQLLWAGTAAYLTYYLVKNRETIKKEALETKELTQEATGQVKDIQAQIAFIQSQIPKVTEMAKDLGNKAQQLQHEADIRMKQMPLLQQEKDE